MRDTLRTMTYSLWRTTAWETIISNVSAIGPN
jgi:hypothetical protein